jgi:hypothetical protein
METRTSWLDGRNVAMIGEYVRHNDSYHPDPRDLYRAGIAIDRAMRDGGYTMDRAYDDVFIDSGAYIVAGKNPGRVYPVTAGRDELAYQLSRYIVSTPFYIVPTYIGLWVDAGMLRIDTVELVYDVLDALRKGKAQGQAAIYCTATATDVRVSDRAIARAMMRQASQALTDALESDPTDYAGMDIAASDIGAARRALALAGLT